MRVVAPVRICAGGGQQCPSLPRPISPASGNAPTVLAFPNGNSGLGVAQLLVSPYKIQPQHHIANCPNRVRPQNRIERQGGCAP